MNLMPQSEVEKKMEMSKWNEKIQEGRTAKERFSSNYFQSPIPIEEHQKFERTIIRWSKYHFKLGDKECSLQAFNPLCAYSELYALPLDDRVIVERIEEKGDNSGRIMTPDIVKENGFYDSKGHQYHKSYSVFTGKKDTVSFCLLTICIQ